MGRKADIIRLPQSEIEGRVYASDKPCDCRYCYYWDMRRSDCIRDKCWYLLPLPKNIAESFDVWLDGVEIGHVENDLAESNRNETTERDESYQMPYEKDNVKAADSASSMDNAGEKQETTEYQKMQEKFLQNLMNTYMMIKHTGNRR